MKRKYSVNDNFFKVIDSEEKAYLLGFFLADGSYNLGTRCTKSYRYQVRLQGRDKSIIDFFQNFICPENSIKYKKAYVDKKGVSHQDSYAIRWTSRTMHEDLMKFNITPRKTYDLNFNFPFEKIPNKFIWDFIRGFFDGDGQISYSEERHQMTFALYGTSEVFMNSLGEYFEKEFNVKRRVEGVQKSKMTLYTLRFSSNYHRTTFIKALYEKFYKNKKYFLKRKQEKMLSYLLFKYRDNFEDCERLQSIVERS